MNPALHEQVLTVKEVAQYLKVNDRTVYRMAVAGRIPAFKIGNTWRIRESDLNAWIKEQYSQQQ
jgi:excisionase family DNA binding protein